MRLELELALELERPWLALRSGRLELEQPSPELRLELAHL